MFRKPFLYGLFYALCGIFILELLIWVFSVPEYVFPLPSRVFQYWWEHAHLFLYHSVITFLEAFIGVLLAWGIGILFGGICVYFKIFDRLFSPLIFGLQVIPVIAVGPFIVLWFGFGILSKIWVVFIFALYPIVMAFKEGVMSVDPQLFQVAQLLKAKRFSVFFHILLPACLLRTFLGVKIALTYSVTSAVVGELLGASVGLGVLLVRALADFNALALFGDIYTIIIMSVVLFSTISFFETKARRRLGL